MQTHVLEVRCCVLRRKDNMANERYPLRQIIFEDLIRHNKVALVLLALVVTSAVATVWITHQTRLLTAEQSKLLQLNRKLETRYIHLQLEESSLSNVLKVEGVASQLGLQAVKSDQEIILEVK